MKSVPGPVEGWTFDRDEDRGLLMARCPESSVAIVGEHMTTLGATRVPLAVVRALLADEAKVPDAPGPDTIERVARDAIDLAEHLDSTAPRGPGGACLAGPNRAKVADLRFRLDALLADEALTVGQALADARVQGGTHVHQVDPPSRSPFQVAEFARSCATCAPPRSPMPSPDRCPRCDRAECPWHLLPDPDSDDDRALFSADRARADANCRAHELTIEQWRAEALALRARLADPPSLAPLRARAEALLAVAERASPQPWIQSGERRCIDTGRIDGRGDVCDGYSLAPVPNEYDPAEEWEADAPAIVAFRNDAPALIRDLLAALTTPKSETARSPEPFLDAARCGTSSVAAGKVPASADIGNLVDEFGAAAERLGCDPCNADRARAKAVARKALLAALAGKDGAA